MIFCKTKTFLIFGISLLLLTSGGIKAETLTLEDLVYWGLENAPAQQEMKNELEQAIREIEKVVAGAGWQLDVRGLSQYDLAEGEFRRQSIGLHLDRRFIPGINLQGSLTYGKATGVPGMADQDYEPDLSLSIGYRVFPRVPSDTERTLLSRQVALERLQNTLPLQQSQNILGWIEDYLDLARKQEELQKARTSLARVEEELEEVQRQKEIGEAGEIQLIDSRVAHLRAQATLETIEKSIERDRKEFYRSLGLPEEKEIELEVSAGLVDELWEWVEDQGIEEMDREEKVAAAFAVNPELKNLQLEIEQYKKQVEWFEEGQKPRVDLSGSVDGWHEDWGVGIGVEVNYNLFDSGRDDLEKEDLKAQGRDLERRKADLEKDIKARLTTLEEAVESAGKTVDEKKLLLRRSELEMELKEDSFQKGLATIRDYNQAVQALEQAEHDYLEARDDWLFARIQLAYFLGKIIDWGQGVE